MPDDTSRDPEFEREPESLPKREPLPLDDLPPGSDWGPRVADLPRPDDFGIPGIDLDPSGRFKVPKLKADYSLLEQAKSEFFMGLDMDEAWSIAWLWPGHIPIGKLTLIEGESNSGTSFLVADLAARVTRGNPWPGAAVSVAISPPAAGSPPAGIEPVDTQPPSPQPTGPQPIAFPRASHVLFVNGGDNLYDTLVPRLLKMGASLYDFTVISAITTHDPAEMRKGKADTDRRLALPADLGHIEYQLRQRPDTRLVVVDSLSDFCHTDKQFRETVRGLHEIAERCNVAVVATARPKNDRRARSKLTPSADRRSESVRCVLNVLVDPHDPSQRYLAPARLNFCKEPQWIPFRIGEGVVEWGQELETAPVYERHSPADQEKRTVLREAMECLYDTLKSGDMPAKTALTQVMECGFSKGTIIRARRELGVRSYREGWGLSGWWCWSLKKVGEGQEAASPLASGGENGNGDEAKACQVQPARKGSRPEQDPSPADEFAGVNFGRLSRNEVIESLNHLRALELAATGETLPNGKPGKNGKPSKNGKRKPR